MRLSGIAQEIADVIGRQRALYLIGQLPRVYCKSNGVERREYVCMYVPKQITTQHNLVRILGWNDAMKLVKHFGGEILQPGNCMSLYAAFRDSSITRLHAEGMNKFHIVELMGVSERHVRNLIREKPQEEIKAANDNNVRTDNNVQKLKNERTSKHRRVAR